MIEFLKRLLSGEDRTCGVSRSPKWAALRAKWLKQNPACAVCGRRDATCTPHHKIPVSVDGSRELDETNLITLCEGPANCHLAIGHLHSWSSYNRDVVIDAELWRNKIIHRP